MTSHFLLLSKSELMKSEPIIHFSENRLTKYLSFSIVSNSRYKVFKKKLVEK